MLSFLCSRHGLSSRTIALAALFFGAYACSGSSSGSPSAPSSPPASITISNFTVTASVSGTTRSYRMSFTMTETSGRSGAAVNTIRFGFGAGVSANGDPTSPIRIAAGTSASSGIINLVDDAGATASATSTTLSVGWTDDSGRTGSATSVATFSQPAPEPVARTFTLAGVIGDLLSGRAVVGATVAATDSTNTRRTSTTDGNGYYSIAPLREGSISVTITATGYQATTRTVALTSDTRFEPLIFPTSTPAATLSCGAPSVVTCINGGQQGTPTASCSDGAWSCSTTASGTCSGHGGIGCRVCPGPLCAVSSTPSPSPAPPPTRTRIGATCNDGSSSDATGSGACSSHGGVRCWRYNDGSCTNP